MALAHLWHVWLFGGRLIVFSVGASWRSQCVVAVRRGRKEGEEEAGWHVAIKHLLRCNSQKLFYHHSCLIYPWQTFKQLNRLS